MSSTSCNGIAYISGHFDNDMNPDISQILCGMQYDCNRFASLAQTRVFKNKWTHIRKLTNPKDLCGQPSLTFVGAFGSLSLGALASCDNQYKY